MTTIHFVSFCPLGDRCRKGGGRLGFDLDVESARWRIANHLVSSQYHNMSQVDADAEAAAATSSIVQEEVPMDTGKETAKPAFRGDDRNSFDNSSKGHGRGKGWAKQDGKIQTREDWHSNWRRSEPYTDNRQYTNNGRYKDNMVVANKTPDLVATIARCEAAARTAARMARAAASAFEEEAYLLRHELEKLSSSDAASSWEAK